MALPITIVAACAIAFLLATGFLFFKGRYSKSGIVFTARMDGVYDNDAPVNGLTEYQR